MPYNKCTVSEIVEAVNSKKILLPPIQRKFVWEEDQMTKLLDSMMQGYPFGTFLFWNVSVKTINDEGLPVYEFIKDFDERGDNANNKPASVSHKNPDEYIRLALDGQQRLTTLYISLCGSLRKKIPKKRWDNPDAFPEKELYFNLLSNTKDEQEGILYEFAFLTKAAAEEENPNKLWFKVKDLTYSSESEISTQLLQPRGWMDNPIIMGNIFKLFETFKRNEYISYYDVPADKRLDDVLDIFVRVNSGGTVLSKTDLLFSTIANHWKDARKEFDDFVANINTIGDHYEFDNDFIMRTCLYILDLPILMTVSSFGKNNVATIREDWANIKSAIKDTIALLDELGFSSDNIISSNAILPIIYYRYKAGKDALTDEKVKKDVRRYFIVSQIKKAFGGHSNQTLDKFRASLKKSGEFDYAKLKDLKLAYDNDLSCTKDDIKRWMGEFKKGPYTFLLLTLLYPNLKYSQYKFEQDHIHPDAGFSKSKLKKIITPDGEPLTVDEIDDWREKSGTLPNLHLLDPKTNEERQDTPLEKWLEQGHEGEIAFLPQGISYNFANFKQFYLRRKKMLIEALDLAINGPQAQSED